MDPVEAERSLAAGSDDRGSQRLIRLTAGFTLLRRSGGTKAQSETPGPTLQR